MQIIDHRVLTDTNVYSVHMSEVRYGRLNTYEDNTGGKRWFVHCSVLQKVKGSLIVTREQRQVCLMLAKLQKC